jgi:SAM-dependent methyltransferase
MNCICGESSYTESSREGLITTENGQSEKCNIPLAICSKCKTQRQIDLPFDDEESYDEYYSKKYPPVNKKYNISTYRADIGSAKKRFKKMKMPSSGKVLDVGCGSGALVDVCIDNGLDAVGCELVKYHYAPKSNFIYYRKFENVHFPTDNFDRIVRNIPGIG